MPRAPFATISDIAARHPAELVLLAADETTGLRDDARIEAAIGATTADMVLILKGRYSSEELDRLDPESREALKSLATDITLYKVALSFARSSERLEKIHDAAIKRLEALVAGRGGLSFEGSRPGDGGSGSGDGEPDSVAPNEPVVIAPERVFTRQRLRGI